MRVTFEEVSYHARKSKKCPVCGKTCTLSKKFFQTLNPFNKNTDGTVKTKSDIYKELTIKIVEWKKTPATHQKCEEAT